MVFKGRGGEAKRLMQRKQYSYLEKKKKKKEVFVGRTDRVLNFGTLTFFFG